MTQEANGGGLPSLVRPLKATQVNLTRLAEYALRLPHRARIGQRLPAVNAECIIEVA